MKKLFTLPKALFVVLLLILISSPSATWCQTSYSAAGGVVASNTFECYPLPVMNGNTLLDSVNGISSVCLDLNTNRIQNLDFYLFSPTGAYSPLAYGVGTGSVNGSLCFKDNALNPYSGGSGGVYSPLLELGNINHGSTGTGVWEMCVVNDSGGPAATINSWGFTLGGADVAPTLIQMGNHSCMVEANAIDLFDSGGLTYNYDNEELNINTVCPPIDGMCMRASINWSIELNYDFLDIYDGDSLVASNLLGSATGTGSALVQSPSGCLTFVFESDNTITDAGYDVELSCVPCAAAVASARPANDDCISAIPLSGLSGNHGATGCDIAGPSPHGTDTCSWVSTENSVFYTFEVTPSTPQPVEITLDNVNCTGGANQLQCALYDNDCSSVGVFGANFHGCASGLGTVILRSATSNLSPGSYIFVVDGNAGSECDWAVQSVVLAVDWMDFSAEFLVETSQVELDWITSNEKNNEGFWVQRSRDLQRWTSLEFVPANEGIDNLHHYGYTDNGQQEEGPVHYRLKQMDLDGKSHYSNTVTVNIGRVQEAAVVRTFPNPTAKIWTLEYAVPESEEVNLQIFDQRGLEVFRHREKDLEMGIHSFSVPMGDWAPGIYFYRLNMGQKSESGKIVRT